MNKLMRLNVPEKTNRSTPHGPGISRSLPADKPNTRDHKINRPGQELDEITARPSPGKGRKPTGKEKLILELFT